MHGKTSPVSHDGTGLFEGLPSPFTATRYNSLVVPDIPPELIVYAPSNDTMVMGFRHSSLPIHGVQFHFQIIAPQHGQAILANFMKMARMKLTRQASA